MTVQPDCLEESPLFQSHRVRVSLGQVITGSGYPLEIKIFAGLGQENSLRKLRGEGKGEGEGKSVAVNIVGQ